MFAGVDSFRAALDYHIERHNVLSSNIAHVDTPGYVPRDVERVQALNFPDALHVAMARTQSAHIAPLSQGMPSTGRLFADRTAGGGNDNNYVSLDREAAKLAANQIRYDVLTAMVTGKLSSLAWAAGDARSG
jgi:flagellar basal-body rod protein FlgB